MFGDGATNQGTFGETMNLAALWKLPVVFLVINNQFGMGTALQRHSAVTDLSKKAEGFGVPGTRVRRHGRARRALRGRPSALRLRARGAPAAAGRGGDLPLPRPLHGRPRGVPHQGGGGGVARARPDRLLRQAARGRGRARRGGGRGARRGGDRDRGRGGEVRRRLPVPRPRLALRRRLRATAARCPAGGPWTSARPRCTAARTSARPARCPHELAEEGAAYAAVGDVQERSAPQPQADEGEGEPGADEPEEEAARTDGR